MVFQELWAGHIGEREIWAKIYVEPLLTDFLNVI